MYTYGNMHCLHRNMYGIFEVLMLLCFAISWPFNIRASLKARTAKNRSIVFELLVEMGYIFGMLNKIVNNDVNYVFAFYLLDFFLVLTDILIYVRNRRLDRLAEGCARVYL